MCCNTEPPYLASQHNGPKGATVGRRGGGRLAALRRSGGVAPHSGKAFSSGPYFLKPFLVCTPKTFSVVNTKGKKGIQFNKGLTARPRHRTMATVSHMSQSFVPCDLRITPLPRL